MSRYIRQLAVVFIGLLIVLIPIKAEASPTPTLNQTINDGTLSTDIFQSGDVTPVAAPTVSFTPVNESFSCQTSSATLGDSNNLINVTNLNTQGSHSGWTLTIAATGGDTATWSDGSGHSFSYNNSAGSGCTGGQLTVNPSTATITDDCNSVCNNTNVSLGSSTALSSPSTDSATLMVDSTYTPWEGYVTGISMSQKIPAEQYAASYSLPMTITVTAN